MNPFKRPNRSKNDMQDYADAYTGSGYYSDWYVWRWVLLGLMVFVGVSMLFYFIP